MSGDLSKHKWVATPAPWAGRYDDVLFLNADLGWAVNGNSHVLKTTDGAVTWSEPLWLGGLTPRCIGMVDKSVGWIGGIASRSAPIPLMRTDDGWNTATPVKDLPPETPPAVCGIYVLDERHIFAAGTNYPDRPTGFLKSEDGGETWCAWCMKKHAAILVDIYFKSPNEGWIVGAQTTKPYPRRADVYPVVLRTEDGGSTWADTLPQSENPPLGEWGWKIQFVDDDFAVIANENFNAGAILISEDGGRSWRRQEVLDTAGRMVNENLEGIGFIDRNTGWVGGWGDKEVFSGRTSGTTDGGRTWTDLTESWPDLLPGVNYTCPPSETRGQYINRFRFIDGVGYASGNTVYKYTDEEWPEQTRRDVKEARLVDTSEPLLYTDHVSIPVRVLQEGAKLLRVEVFDRFGGQVRTLVEQQDPSKGHHEFSWNLRDDGGNKLPHGQYMVRVTCDGSRDSSLIFRDRRSECQIAGEQLPHLLLDG